MTPFALWLAEKAAFNPPLPTPTATPGGFFRYPGAAEQRTIAAGQHNPEGSGKPIVPKGFPLAPTPQGANPFLEKQLLHGGNFLYDTPQTHRSVPGHPGATALTETLGYNRPVGPHYLYERHPIAAAKPPLARGPGAPQPGGLATQKPGPFGGEVPAMPKPQASPLPVAPPPKPLTPIAPGIPGIPKISREYTPGEDCPHCHAALERSEDGVCNSCHKPWPEKKAVFMPFGSEAGKPLSPFGSGRQPSTMAYQVPGSDRNTIAQILGSGPTTDVVGANKPLRTGLNRYSDLPPLQPNELSEPKPAPSQFDGMDTPPAGLTPVPEEPVQTGMPTETTGLAKWWPLALGGIGAMGAGGLGAYYLNRKKKRPEEEDEEEEKQAAKKADCGPTVKKTDKAESQKGMYHCLECGHVHYAMGDAEKCCEKGVVLERKAANDGPRVEFVPPSPLLTTGLGGLLGLAAAPKGYIPQSAGRGAVQGFGTAAGAGLGHLLHRLSGAPGGQLGNLAAILGGGGVGFLGARDLVGKHPRDREREERRQEVESLAQAVRGGASKAAGDLRIPVTAPKTMKAAPIPAAPLPQQPVPPVSPLPGDVAKTTLSVSPQPVNTATAAPAGGSTKKADLFGTGGFLDRNLPNVGLTDAYNSVTTGAGQNAAKGFMDQLGLGGGGGGAAGGSFLDRNPWARLGLIGAPIGAGLGLVGGLMNRKKKKNAFGDALTGGLLGAGAGALVGGIPMLFGGGKKDVPTMGAAPPTPETVPPPAKLPTAANAPDTVRGLFTQTPTDINANKNLLEAYRIGNKAAPTDEAAADKLRSLDLVRSDATKSGPAATALARQVASTARPTAAQPDARALAAVGGFPGLAGTPGQIGRDADLANAAEALIPKIKEHGVTAPGGGNVLTGVGGQSAFEAAGAVGLGRLTAAAVAKHRGINPVTTALKNIDASKDYQPGRLAKLLGFKPTTAADARATAVKNPDVMARTALTYNTLNPQSPLDVDAIGKELQQPAVGANGAPGRSATVNRAIAETINAGGRPDPKAFLKAVADHPASFESLVERVAAQTGRVPNQALAANVRAMLTGATPVSADVARELERVAPGVAFAGRPALTSMAPKPGLFTTARRGLIGGHSPLNPINLGIGTAISGGRQYFMGNPARTIGEATLGTNLSPLGLVDTYGRNFGPAAVTGGAVDAINATGTMGNIFAPPGFKPSRK